VCCESVLLHIRVLHQCHLLVVDFMRFRRSTSPVVGVGFDDHVARVCAVRVVSRLHAGAAKVTLRRYLQHIRILGSFSADPPPAPKPARLSDHPATHIGHGWGLYIVRADGGWLHEVFVPPPDKYTRWN